MNRKSELLNALLMRTARAAAETLSPVGRAAAYPDGIPAQAAQARGCEINATIGQITDDTGRAVPLSSMADALNGLDPRGAFLYSAQGGIGELRLAWRRFQQVDASRVDASGIPTSLPQVTAGLTEALYLVAQLFTDPETAVLLPRPCWGNYNAIFGLLRSAELRGYDVFTPDGGFNIDALADALEAVRGRKALLVLNMPGNPTGYTPTREAFRAIAGVILAHPGPLVVVCDDAYHGMVYTDDALVASPFWELTRRADPARLLPIKIDGATKELMFFGGRIGFLTFGVEGPAADALEDKARAINRATVSAMPGPSQLLVLKALTDPRTGDEIAATRAMLRARWSTLVAALAEAGPPLSPYPCNAGCFALVRVDPSIPVGQLRRRLILDQSVGVVAVESVNALRIAFCSTPEAQIPELVRRIREVLGA